ncbi:TRAP transporter substrate-binding protein [Kerstersia gyiorum]|uniref:ABC transporter substrate-binding protein n=1 Tax=Kerstersia gyiorum TaxID=206506 RepID=A0A171KPN5_9BURK|nr:TRAP transporter substrate-binding protein [Kerstersia gyiorum]KKO70852.1 ABC transporter substrate-binding protein [Kerstersia gyiorum]QBR39200.1 TRAP transporter substrate-binding protein [Kerstersia gyiorum]
MFAKQFIKAALLAAGLAASSAALAQDIQARTLKLATASPEGHAGVVGAHRFADLVAEKSGGKMKVNLFPGGVLGGDAQTISATQGGTIDFVLVNTGIFSNQVKEAGIFDFPFLFASAEEADKVVDGPVGQAIHKKFEDKGMVGLAYWELGFRNITNNRRPIQTVEDIDGLKLRVIPSTINLDWVRAVGGNPTPLAWPEVYAALEQRAIDGQENPVTIISANRLDEVQKHMVMTRHVYNPQSLVMSKRTWDKLSEAEQTIVSDAAKETAVFQRQYQRESEGAALEKLKQGGMQVTELSDEQQQHLRELMKPVIAKHAAIVGQETVDAVQAELAGLRGE